MTLLYWKWRLDEFKQNDDTQIVTDKEVVWKQKFKWKNVTLGESKLIVF